MRVLKSYQYALLVVLVLVTPGCKECPTTAPPLKPARLVEVAVYGEALQTGCTLINLQSGRLEACRGYLSDGKGWGILEASVSAEKQAELRRLVESATLRDFQPEAKWFGESSMYDTGSYLVITWTDKEVAFAMPPEDVRGNLPALALPAYQRIDEIANWIDAVEYASSQVPSAVRVVSNDDARARECELQLERVIRISLPQQRYGW